MRHILMIPFVFFSLSAASQATIQLVLNSDAGSKIDKVEMFDISQKEYYSQDFRDTLIFNFKKENIDCYNIRYHSNGKMFRQQIWLEPGLVRVETHVRNNELVIDTVINSPFYYEVARFGKQYSGMMKTRDTIAVNDFLLSTFQKHIDNPFSLTVALHFITLNQNRKLNLLRFKSLADQQGDKFDWFLLYPTVIGRVNKILTVDRIEAAAYTFMSLVGERVNLSLTGAQYYILDFWFLSCLPCVEQHVEIKKKISQLKERNVAVIGISTDNNLKIWKEYLTKHGYNWLNYLQAGSGITSDLSIASFPTYLIIDGKGNILNSYNSFSDVLKRFGVEE